jgi:hypothetical protein
VYGHTFADSAVFNTGDDILGFLGNEDSADRLLPDWVFFLGQLGHIAMISLECLV